jgi:excisionase family DNA binding protein
MAPHPSTSTGARAPVPEQRGADPARWLSFKACAQYAGKSEEALRTFVKRRRIPFHKSGGRLRFDPQEIDTWIRQEQQQHQRPRPRYRAPRSKPRLYSTAFPVHRGEPRLRVEIDRVPGPLYRRVKKAARQAGMSMRELTLRLWKAWATDVLRKDSGTSRDEVA